MPASALPTSAPPSSARMSASPPRPPRRSRASAAAVAVTVGAVGAGVLVQRQRARLDDHVVVRGRLLGGEPLELGAQRRRSAPCRSRPAARSRGSWPSTPPSAARSSAGCASAPRRSSRPSRSPRARRASPARPVRHRLGAGASAAGRARPLPWRPPFDVGLDDPPAGTGAGEGVQVHAALAGDPPRQRRGLHAVLTFVHGGVCLDVSPAGRPEAPAATLHVRLGCGSALRRGGRVGDRGRPGPRRHLGARPPPRRARS